MRKTTLAVALLIALVACSVTEAKCGKGSRGGFFSRLTGGGNGNCGQQWGSGCGQTWGGNSYTADFYSPQQWGTPGSTTPTQSGPKYYPPSGEYGQAAATILTINVPANASVWINDQPTQQSGSKRTFSTPNLSPGTYTYTIRAAVPNSSNTYLMKEQVVNFHAGESPTVTFAFDSE